MRRFTFSFPAIADSLAWAALLLTASLPVLAGTIVVGKPADSGTGSCYPFGCNYDSVGNGEFQQVYTHSLFSGPVTITGLEFFNSAANSGATAMNTGAFTVSLSTTSADWNTLNATQANNIGPDETQVFSGSLTQPWAFGDTLSIPFSTPFTYTPGQDANLLLNIVATGTGDAGGLLFFDTNGFTNVNLPGNNSIFAIAYPSQHDFPHQVVTTGYGLVTGFNTTSTVIPEPATFALLGAGLLGLSWLSRRTHRR